MRFLNLTGMRFGSLKAVSPIKNKWGSFSWKCSCKCGGATVALGRDLRRGHTTSCGCGKSAKLSARSTTHGHTIGRKPTSEYRTWCSMKDRCYNPNNRRFHDYGGRGITVCQLWIGSFSEFLKDMGSRPRGLTLERINNNGNYDPRNCIWATRKAQANNNRHNRKLTKEGVSLTVSQWSDKLGIPPSRLYQRIWRGWSDLEVLS